MDNQQRRSVKFLYGFEPCYLLIHFGYYLAMAIVQNQMLKQQCLISGYNITICSKINADNTTGEIEKIQPKVADVNSAIMMLNSFFPPLYSLILGSWSDIYGRKPIMMMSFIGYSMTLILFAIFAYVSDHVVTLSPWIYFFAEFPMCLLGGWPLLDVAACCYVTDISEKSKHSIRLSTIGFINITMNFCANMSSSFIYEATSSSVVFIISFFCCMAGLILVITLVDESINIPQNITVGRKISGIISFSRLSEIFRTLFKYRLGKKRKILWCLVGIAILAVFTMHGNGTVGYLFGQNKFKWGLRDYTIYDATNTAITAFGILVCLATLKKYFKISDINLGLISISSAIIESIVKAFARETYQMYLASCLGVFRVLMSPMFRSVMSNTFSSQEIGKIFSSATAMEAFSGMGAGPLYSNVYKATLTTFPGAFHLISASVFGIALILALIVFRWNRKVYNADALDDNEQENINQK